MRKVYILFGPPGCGKGTQAERLVKKYDLLHISTGDLLRDEIARKTDLGNEAKKYMDEGMLVPDEIVIAMIAKLIEANSKVSGFLFDGFPRTREQAAALGKMLAEHNIQLAGVIFLRVPDELLVKRILKRGETSGRPDDLSEERIRTRLEEYVNKTAPVYDYYKDGGMPVVDIDGVGEIDVIEARINEALDELV